MNINVLLGTAAEAGVTTGSGSLCNSIKQQLEQSGMLPQLAAVMRAMTADMQDEAAALKAAGGDAAIEGSTLSATRTSRHLLNHVLDTQGQLMNLWAGTLSPAAISWLCDPNSAHTAAALRLIVTALQRDSSIMHVLPAMQQRAPQQAEVLLDALQRSTHRARMLSTSILGGVERAAAREQQGQDLQQLLLSPHLLTCAAAMIVLWASDVDRAVAAGCAQAQSSSGSKSNRSNSSKGRSTGQRTQQQQSIPSGNDASSSRSSSDNAAADNLSACQLQLLQLLGLASEMPPGTKHQVALSEVARQLLVVVRGCSAWCTAARQHYANIGTGSGLLQAQQQQQQQQQWQFEGQLLLLLPTVLLPCASRLLSASAQGLLPQQQGESGAYALLQVTLQTLSALAQLQLCLQRLGVLCSLLNAVWVQEVLSAVLQLADQLLYQQQPPELAEPAAATLGPTPSSSSESPSGVQQAILAKSACRLLSLLADVARVSQYLSCVPGSSSDSDSAEGTAAVVAAAEPPVAARFVEFGSAFEAALRAVTAAAQSGVISTAEMGLELDELCADLLLPRHGVYTHSMLVQHMGLCGPVALAQEQRQLYSLLGTVLKLGRGGFGGAWPCLDALGIGSSCLAVGQPAVGLLRMAAAAAGQQPPSAAAAAAAAEEEEEEQQPTADYLPSLVLFGRCCLQWAEQLRQQAPELMLLVPGAPLQEQQRRNLERYQESSVRVCLPALWQGDADVPVDSLNSLVGTVSGWVGVLVSPAALTRLHAASCGPQQLQQQLDALLAAQQGAQQGLTDTSLAVLVQQLQTTGAMLCNTHCSATLLQQCGLQEHQRPHRGVAGVAAQLRVCGVSHGPLLWAGVSAGGMEAPQACVQGAGSCGSRVVMWRLSTTSR
jgi:hypothetical protein